MNDKTEVKIGMIGVGGMGSSHARRIAQGEVPGAVLAAVSDIDESRFEGFPDVPHFTDPVEMLKSGIDAVIIATPHYDHTTLSISAFEHSVHVLSEKPLGVHKADCQRTIDAYEKRTRDDLVFAVMFNQRTVPVYRKLKSLLDSGELGRIQRVNWIITDWFRTDHYYNSGGWRATWEGEGGGVLLNQCPHQLDLMQWLFGLPRSVRAFGGLGKYHDIEVEDEVTAFLEYEDGATGVFIASTGEAPGTNRLEIAADRGRVVVENGAISWERNEVPTSVQSKTATGGFARPELWHIDVSLPAEKAQQHCQVMRQFVAAIQGEGELVAHGSEGIRSVELGNAMLLGMLTDKTVDLPMDGAEFETKLKELISGSIRS